MWPWHWPRRPPLTIEEADRRAVERTGIPPRADLPAMVGELEALRGMGWALAEAANNLAANSRHRPLTDDERALYRFRARHAGDPPAFKWERGT